VDRENKTRINCQDGCSILLTVLLLVAASLAFSGCGAGPGKHAVAGSTQKSRADAQEKKAKEEAKPYVLVGAGDIAACSALAGAEATAKLVEQIPGTVFAAGDLAYERGSAQEFRDCYGTTWGRFRDRTRPTPGNHEYNSGAGAPYFAYWGAQAGTPEKSYYSFDLGKWHVIALNTNCVAPGVGGCGIGSPQEKWLKQDLADHAKSCIVAFGHHALYSSGVFRSHAVHPELRDLWRDLYEAHADLILAGHEHSYERFAPQDADGNADKKNGIREIVVGTGGRSHDPLGTALPNSEVRDFDTYGVLKVTLWPERYAWEFIPVNAGGFRDSGEGECHNAKAPTPSN
jgi:acid phosphatase type 7